MPTLLVVDDSNFMRKRIVRTLVGAKYTIVEAVNGEDALTKLEAAPPDLLMTDLLMPIMDGPSLIEAARAGGFDGPIVVMTADIQSSTREQCNALGINGFLNKPCSSEDMLAAVSTALASSQPKESAA